MSSLGEAFAAQEKGADYIMVGSMFAPVHSEGARIVSFDEFRRIRDKVSLPIYAFGGIKYDNAQMVKRLGADGIALMGDVIAVPDARSALESIMAVWSRS